MATLTAVFNARDRISKKMDAMSKATSKVTDTFKNLGKVAGKALLGIGAVATGVAVKSLADFSSFDRGMREVWTLLPNMSEEAFGSMQKDVLEFSKKMKVLPEDTIPALYQAISAGVPKENVFDFLTIAQKAAKGGVTELETAVDGISSVMNAYGAEVIGATVVSDLMFTAVKNGKTSFSEMSSSLFQVIPTAASLGVEFGNVTAALATMTAQGTPTSVATNQLRAMFTELSKSGSGAAKKFEELSGKTFKKFISEGGNVQGALQVMEKESNKLNVSISDLFSSSEAGAAALAVTGKGAESFTKNLNDMEKAAGATETANSRMEGGLSDLFQNIKVRAKVVFIELGEKLAPAISELGDKFLENLPKLEEFFAIFLEKVPGIVDSVVTGFSNMYDSISSVMNFISDNQFLIETLVVVFGSLVAIGGAFTLVMTTVNSLMALFAFITSPIGLIVLGITAAIALLYIGFKSGFFEKIIVALKKLPEIFVNVFNGIKNTVLAN